jgi:hypothetical protein
VATRRKSGIVPAVIIMTLIAVALFEANTVVDTVTGWFGGGTEIIGEGDDQVMMADSSKSEAKQCTTQQMIKDKRCGDRKVLLVNAKKMPFIARNTQLAWGSGLPAILTMNRPKFKANRAAACPDRFPRPHGGQCDEYPMARTDEGGKQARAEEVPARENQCQGGSYAAQYPKDGEKFLVVLIYPTYIAQGQFAGTDIAKDQGWC